MFEILLDSRFSDCGRKNAREDSKGGKPLAYWGIFSADLSEREENSLISYGFFKSLLA
ncbi:hypothetical protein KL86DYS1_30480 [uncultured Dysgonomonas sp.]|uniref:Uncharacterized protein n=1 Tax=uncultured Dysgonomonas sp. TaxID=206096 RepID=A0A212JUG2_9BACT|nr:hypothetical protein KL86DYS1_30480 [uncultured Dysgonomonas sp.]